MKLCLVFNPKDSKLVPEAYCSVFKDMLRSVAARFEDCRFLTYGLDAKEIDADVIFFFDPHASHHIEIPGIEKHPAIKVEYWNDMHQEEMYGVYLTTGIKVHKLGRKQRAERAKRRGTRFIVSAVKEAFFKHFGGLLDDPENMLIHFPHAPGTTYPSDYKTRKPVVLGNGATHGGFEGGYDFRAWAFKQPGVEFVPHTIADKSTPKGYAYQEFLSRYMAALACCSAFPVPKYFEIPAAGCLTFAEYHKEYEELGFRDYETCVFVNRNNFRERVAGFTADPLAYMKIAESGRKLMENYTADKFADHIYKTLEKHR